MITNAYDTSGRVTAQGDQLNRAIVYTYTADGTTITDPMGHVTAQGYTAGELTTLTKAVGTPGQATWQYAYDQYTLGVTAVTDPNGNITRHSYDPDGNLTSSTDANGHLTTITYNTLNEPLSVLDPDGVTSSFGYDEAGNLTDVHVPAVDCLRPDADHVVDLRGPGPPG